MTPKIMRGYPDVSGNMISYDDNGNMISHTDKGILEIAYNILDQPDYVKFDKTYVPRVNMGGDYHVNTQYLYRADGSKLRKTYTFGFDLPIPRRLPRPITWTDSSMKRPAEPESSPWS